MTLKQLVHTRWFGILAAVPAVLVLGGLLTATIYWTLFDPRWIAFLGGVLFAALLAVASRASTVEWQLARRTRQLTQLRSRFDEATKRAQIATEALAAAEARMRVPCEPAVAQSCGHAGDLAYLAALSSEAPAWDEPREKLSRALEENQFLLFAQPMADLQRQDPEPATCEIFLRLKEEEDNLLPPGSFFPVAERYGMMEDLDRWVVRELITRCHENPAPAGGALYCVNLSQASVRSHAFARFVQRQLLDRNFDGRSLCFEIAEHDISTCHADLARLITMLKPLGCRFTVDAFGSVAGSFSALKGLDFDFVKIDGVVVQNILRHPAELAKVRAIVAVCRHAGMRTIAEFVEDGETLAALRTAGVDRAQGFGIAKPSPLCKYLAALAAPAPLAVAA
jgi:EAL domain-containing protein (putative c-di-GMP-specific phosphodiesterase class I)